MASGAPIARKGRSPQGEAKKSPNVSVPWGTPLIEMGLSVLRVWRGHIRQPRVWVCVMYVRVGQTLKIVALVRETVVVPTGTFLARRFSSVGYVFRDS